MRLHSAALLALSFIHLAMPLAGFDGSASEEGTGRAYSPYVGKEIPRRVFWGDTHLHTSNSFDAYALGNTSLGPEDAYRFARGGEVISAETRQPAKLRRPLDWLVIADHAEYLGMTRALFEGDPELSKLPAGERWYRMARDGRRVEAVFEMGHSIAAGEERLNHPGVKEEIWASYADIADRYNDPGAFTTLIGYEWTSMPGTGDNLHRVVIYRDGASRARTVLPFSAFDGMDPEDLWRWMANYEDATGGSVIAIPHNGNVSNGLMFAEARLDGSPITPAYATARARWEPLYEVTQIKGDSETHPALSTTDEFANFETWDRGNITMKAAKQPWMLRHEYARSALILGLQFESRLGTNPYKFGLIGSTDSHTALATADDDDFWGKSSNVEPRPDRLNSHFARGEAFDWMTRNHSASGYTGIWGTENSREALFDALRRKEVYATTGPRIAVRFFGGWSFETTHAHGPDLARLGYELGVPMGADLPTPKPGGAPSFLLSALKDPDGANLDRIQVVKGWLDQDGGVHERVYDVAWAGERSMGTDGRLPVVGDTVAIKTASYTNDIGAAQLVTVWNDPDFRPAEYAFYYARVLEIPTPRWTTYDAARYRQPLPKDVPASLQQRAYTSPIWYRPPTGGQ